MSATGAETIIVQVDIQSNNQRLVELTKQLNENRDALKSLNDASKAGRISADELAAGQVRLKQTAANITQETRILTKANADQDAANKASAGSIAQLRAQLATGTTAYNALSKAERDNTDAGQKLQAGNRALSDELKRLEKAVGDTRRNVGNYKDDIKAAAGEMGFFSGNVGQAAAGLKDKLQAGLNLAKAGFGSLKAAIISTGIGALVVVLASMYEYLRSNDEGAERLAGAMAGLGAGVEIVSGYVIRFGEFLFNAFTKPQEAIKNIGKFLTEIVTNPRKAFTSFVESMENGFARVKTQISAAVDAGIKLSALGNKLEDAEIAAIKRNAEAEKQIGRLTLSARDRSLSEEKRLGNLARADELEKQVLNRNLSVERLRLSIITAKNAQDATNSKLQDADRRKQEEQIAKISQLEGAAAEAQQTRQNRRALLLAEIAAKRAAEAEAAALEAQKAIEAEAKRLAARLTEANREYAQAESKLEDHLNKMRALVETDFANGKIGENEYQKQINAIEKAGNAAALVNAKDYGKDTGAIDKKVSDNKIKEANRVKTEKKNINDTETSIQQASLGAAMKISDAAIALFGAESEAGRAALAIKKTLALAEIAINLQRQLSANATYAATLGPLGAPYLITTNALAIAGALAGAATIAGFKQGGYVSGPGTGTSDSIPARLSNGESVMNANSTAMFAPLLSHLNVLGGGVPFAYAAGGVAGQRSGAPLADGGLLARAAGNTLGIDYAALARAMARQPVQVDVRRITYEQGRVATPRSLSTLG